MIWLFCNKSKTIVYNETDIDKFILFNFNEYSKLKVNQINGSSIFNKAIINEAQYSIFPKEIQNIEFEEIENNNLEIKKKDNGNYGVFKIYLKEKNTEIEFILENDQDNNKQKSKSKSAFVIVLIIVSCFIFLLIVAGVFIVLRKRRNSRETEARFKSLKKELVQMSGNDEEEPKGNEN